jgi:hypothetical protein
MNLEDYKNTVDTFLKLTFKKQINTIDRSLNKLSTEYKNDLLLAFFEDEEISESLVSYFGFSHVHPNIQRCVLLGYKPSSPEYPGTPEEVWEEFHCDIDDIFQAYCEILSDPNK